MKVRWVKSDLKHLKIWLQNFTSLINKLSSFADLNKSNKDSNYNDICCIGSIY